jgi:hypothetical protein
MQRGMLQRTIESRLKGSMLTGTTFAIIVINDQSPRLIASFEPFCDCGNGVGLGLASGMIMVECNIHTAPFVIHSLN